MLLDPSFRRAVSLLKTFGWQDPLGSIETALGETDAVRALWPEFDYPWEGAESLLAVAALPLVGYGSLMCNESAAATLSEASLSAARAVVALGGYRVYGRLLNAARVVDRYGPVPPGGPFAALSVQRAADGGAMFNGRLLQIARPDLAGLRQREHGYRLVPMTWLDWYDPAVYGVAYVLCGEPASTSEPLQPHPGYHEVCRRGAREVSPAFERFFLGTTFTGGSDEALVSGEC